MPEALPLEELPGSLGALLEDARAAARTLGSAEARYAFCLASVARAASEQGGRGAPWLDVCARALGLSRTALHPYGLLARRWSADELRGLMQRRTASGRTLTVSHLLLLARLPRSAFEARVERVLAEETGIHALRAQLRAAALPRPKACDEPVCRRTPSVRAQPAVGDSDIVVASTESPLPGVESHGRRRFETIGRRIRGPER